MQNVAVFWDYENCPAPSNVSRYVLMNSIRAMAQTFGVIKSLRAYAAIAEQFSTAKAALLRSELQCSGVSLVDCPYNGRKDVADKMMIVDMLAHAIDNSPSSSVIILISGDRDFAYALSILRLRCYNVVLCAPNNAHTSLLAQASECIGWTSILPGNSMEFSKQPNEEPHRSPTQGFAPSTSRFRGSMEYAVQPDEVRMPVSPYLRHPVKHLDSFSSEARRESSSPGQDHTTNSTGNIRRSNLFNSAHLSAEDNRIPVINSAGGTPQNVPIMLDWAEDSISTQNINHSTDPYDAISTTGIPPVVHGHAITEVRTVDGVSTPARRATPETGFAGPQASGGPSSKTQMMYQLPVTVPLVVNQLRHIDPSSTQTETAEIPYPLLDATYKASSTTTPAVQEASALPEKERDLLMRKLRELKTPFFTSSESAAISSTSSTISAYVTTADQSAPAPLADKSLPGSLADNFARRSSVPVRLTPPSQFKALVRVLQQHRSRGVFKPTRSQVALQVGEPSNGNPYKQAGVAKWAQYAELARKEGIIELGGKEAAAWVALTPKWYDAHAT